MKRNQRADAVECEWWKELSEEDQVVIVQTLGKAVRRKAVRPLLRVLAGRAGLVVRVRVALVLDNLIDRRCIPVFSRIALDSHEDIGLRCVCTEALRWFIERSVVRTTFSMLAQDRNEAIRGSVVCALGTGVQTKLSLLEVVAPSLRVLAHDNGVLSSGVPVATIAAEILSFGADSSR